MYFVDNKGITDPRINLAIEEYLLKTMDVDQNPFLLFYINEPSIIIGKNQNTAEEINTDYVDSNGIHVVRRLSGGGAVYHDHGNLNFSFITKDDGNSFRDFRKFTEPVVKALQDMGVNAELSGRNDLLAEGRKISGNAQFATRGRMFSHGTLLFDTKMDEVVSALKVNKEKIESKGIKSIRSRVANISEFSTRKCPWNNSEKLCCIRFLRVKKMSASGNLPMKIGTISTNCRKNATPIGTGTTANHRSSILSNPIDSQLAASTSACKWKKASCTKRIFMAISSVSAMYRKSNKQSLA